ncbi:MAG: AraC family transcriptional regulator [Verrucomicrobiota bacterium]
MPDTFSRLLSLAESIGFLNQPINQLVDPARRLRREFPPGFPALVRLFSFPNADEMVGDRWLNWHEHFELILPLEGAGLFRNGTQQVAFDPGDLLIVDHNKLHGMVSLDGDHRSLVIHFLPQLVTALDSPECDAVYLWPFLCRPTDRSPIVRGESAEGIEVQRAATRLLEAVFLQGSIEDPVNQAAAKLQLLNILEATRDHLSLTQETVVKEAAQETKRLRMKRVIDFLHLNLGSKIRLDDAARVAGMSPSHFKTVFREIIGMTFSDALTRIRVGEAARLLRESDQSIAQISHETGFSDQSHLVKRFRAIMGETPTTYRRKHLVAA